MRRGTRLKVAGTGLVVVLLGLLVALAGCSRRSGADPSRPLRVGFFPNVTHAQALVGHAEHRFEQGLGKPIEYRQFNAGPSAMEALLAGEVDVSYVGSAPAIAAYARSGEIRVIAGSCLGGAFLVVRDATSAKDLIGQRVATPQLGNTQDVALRSWLGTQGVKVVEAGKRGVLVTPMENSQILALFLRGELAGAWVPEPWASRLVQEAHAKILVDERNLWPNGQFPTTVLVATRSALEKRREDVKAILRVHVALTREANTDRSGFAARTNASLGDLLGKPLKPQVLASAFQHLGFSTDPTLEPLELAAEHARALDFIPTADVRAMVDASLLDEVLAEQRPASSGTRPTPGG